MTKKQTIALIVSNLTSKGSARWGGSTRPFLLAQALKQLGYNIKIVGLAYESANEPLTNIDCDFPVTVIPCPYILSFKDISPIFKKILSEIDSDILYAIKLKPSSFGIALLKKYSSGRPLILDIDDWEMSWYGGSIWNYYRDLHKRDTNLFQMLGFLKHLDHPLYLNFLEHTVNLADAITTHTRFMQKRFGGTYIPNGKDVKLFNPDNYDSQASRLKHGLKEYKTLMFPGAPRPYKGLEDILTALDQINRPDLRLVIVGGSPYDDYDQQLQQKWGKWLIYLPPCSAVQMPEIVAAADIIVVPQRDTPSTLAQFPLKLTDGMAMAKPILATRVGDIPDILDTTGYLVEPSSPEQIATKITEILANLEAANQKGKLARHRCVEYYSIEAMGNILAQVLNPLA